MSKNNFLHFFILSLLISLSFQAEKEDNETDLIDFDAENRPKPDDPDIFYVPIFLTNDIHGYYYWTDATSNDIEYKTGGLDYLANYLTILRKEFGKERVLYFDSGDQFTGGTESGKTKGKIITDFFNAMKCDGATLGNHDYDYSREELDEILKNSEFPYLATNLYDNEEESWKLWDKQELYKIFEIPTGGKEKETVRIGVIGLANVMSSVPSRLGDIKFYDYAEKIKEYANILKDEGVDSIIVLAHAGLQCENQAMSYGIWTKENAEAGKGECKREVYDAVEEIPEGTIDAFLAGHSHMENHVWINGIPILSGTNNAANSHVLYLAFDKKNDYKIIRDEIKMEGPLPTCEKIFSKSKNCGSGSRWPGMGGSSSSSGDNGDLVDYSFHGVKIEKDKNLEEISEKYMEYKK